MSILLSTEVLTTLSRNPAAIQAFPWLAINNEVRKGCGKCPAKIDKVPWAEIRRVKRHIWALDVAAKQKFKELLGTDRVTMHLRDGANQVKPVEF